MRFRAKLQGIPAISNYIYLPQKPEFSVSLIIIALLYKLIVIFFRSRCSRPLSPFLRPVMVHRDLTFTDTVQKIRDFLNSIYQLMNAKYTHTAMEQTTAQRHHSDGANYGTLTSPKWSNRTHNDISAMEQLTHNNISAMEQPTDTIFHFEGCSSFCLPCSCLRVGLNRRPPRTPPFRRIANNDYSHVNGSQRIAIAGTNI